MIWMLKEELAEIVQHLSDAHMLLEDSRRFNHTAPNLYDTARAVCIKAARELWFNGNGYPLVEGGLENCNTNILKHMSEKEKEKCPEPVWPGECPAPKPSTIPKDGNETIIVPIVR